METLIVAGVCACAVLVVACLALSRRIAHLSCALEREKASGQNEYRSVNGRVWEISRRVDRLLKALGYEEVDQPCKVIQRAA